MHTGFYVHILLELFTLRQRWHELEREGASEQETNVPSVQTWAALEPRLVRLLLAPFPFPSSSSVSLSLTLMAPCKKCNQCIFVTLTKFRLQQKQQQLQQQQQLRVHLPSLEEKLSSQFQNSGTEFEIFLRKCYSESFRKILKFLAFILFLKTINIKKK